VQPFAHSRTVHTQLSPSLTICLISACVAQAFLEYFYSTSVISSQDTAVIFGVHHGMFALCLFMLAFCIYAPQNVYCSKHAALHTSLIFSKSITPKLSI